MWIFFIKKFVSQVLLSRFKLIKEKKKNKNKNKTKQNKGWGLGLGLELCGLNFPCDIQQNCPTTTSTTCSWRGLIDISPKRKEESIHNNEGTSPVCFTGTSLNHYLTTHSSLVFVLNKSPPNNHTEAQRDGGRKNSKEGSLSTSPYIHVYYFAPPKLLWSCYFTQ